MVPLFQPDFLIIGAAKAATTWLQRCLQAQPSVFMPDPELHYFSREFHRAATWYNDAFAAAPEGVLIGEKSNSYFDQPEAMRRIRQHVPKAKLILQLRNPIERAYSDYCMLYRRGEVDARIERYFQPGGPTNDRFLGDQCLGDRFLEGGRYGRHLDQIDDLFPDEQILVVVYDDVLQHPDDHLAAIRDFLAIPALTPITTRVKDKTEAVVPPPMKRFLKRLKPVLSPYRGHPWFNKARKLVAREPRYPPLSPDLHAWLRDYYAEDIDQLARRLDRDLTAWLADPSHPEPENTAAATTHTAGGG